MAPTRERSMCTSGRRALPLLAPAEQIGAMRQWSRRRLHLVPAMPRSRNRIGNIAQAGFRIISQKAPATFDLALAETANQLRSVVLGDIGPTPPRSSILRIGCKTPATSKRLVN